MEKYPIDFSLPENMEYACELKVLKRRIPMRVDFLKGEEARKYVSSINGLVFFYRFFETRVPLRHGDVLLATFNSGCGAELRGSHYCVVLLDSSAINQVVTIIPLKSNKGRELNPASDIYLGDIPGMINGKGSIAVVNQIKTIDKRRFFNELTIRNLERCNLNCECADYKESFAQMKSIFRLTKEQYEKLHTAVRQYVLNGYIKHDE